MLSPVDELIHNVRTLTEGFVNTQGGVLSEAITNQVQHKIFGVMQQFVSGTVDEEVKEGYSKMFKWLLEGGNVNMMLLPALRDQLLDEFHTGQTAAIKIDGHEPMPLLSAVETLLKRSVKDTEIMEEIVKRFGDLEPRLAKIDEMQARLEERCIMRAENMQRDIDSMHARLHQLETRHNQHGECLRDLTLRVGDLEHQTTFELVRVEMAMELCDLGEKMKAEMKDACNKAYDQNFKQIKEWADEKIKEIDAKLMSLDKDEVLMCREKMDDVSR